MRFFDAALFLYVATIKNRALRLVRHPKYLVFAALGLFAFGNRLFFGVVSPLSRGEHGRAFEPDAAAALGPTTLLLVAAGVFVYVALLWIFGSEEASLPFTEAEVRFLFSAPIGRGALLHYKIAQTLIGSLFGALVLTVVGGRGKSSGFFALGFFLALATLALHRIGAAFARTSLAERGTTAERRRLVTLAVAALIACAFLAAFAATAKTLPRLGESPAAWLEALSAWPREHAETLSWVLLPLTAPARVMFATSLGELLRALPAALALLALHYAWVVSSVVAFEEASAAAAETRAKNTTRTRSGRRALRAGARPFALAATGAPWVALAWKSLAASAITRRTGLAMIAVVTASLGATLLPEAAGALAAAALAAIAVVIALFGPIGVRSDLRGDLDNLDLLRSYPLSARDVVRGSVIAPFAVLTGWTWCTLFAAAIASAPSLHRTHLALLFSATAGAAVVLPAFLGFGLLVQNVLALSFPALTTGDASARGLEASGQRMVAIVVMIVVLAVTLLPAGLVSTVALVATQSTLGDASWVIAGFAGAAVIAAESVIALRVAARAFERLDVTER